ncbi:MAG: Holliday junction resolvase RuvX [Cytophagales bacterium]|nr:Holliday junction resolvase RuvX [Cytophagales bacterium]
MARILAIDYGGKRCGLAVTDPDQIIANPIGFEPANTLLSFLKEYFTNNEVERVVIGHPTKADGSDTNATGLVMKFIERFKVEFPAKPIVLHDESHTSKMAMGAMVASGMKKKKRREKGMVDTIAATLILQSYMESER